MKLFFTTLIIFCCLLTPQSIAAERPIVIELYTSQSCSSCPPAEEILKSLMNDDRVLPLSFHVNYWNNYGWTDTLSSQESTDRQWEYSDLLGGRPYTPQMIIDGHLSALGSRHNEIEDAINEARKDIISIPVSVKPDTTGDNIVISIGGGKIPGVDSATIWEFRFQRYSMINVESGENRGRTLSSVNSVIEIKPIAQWNGEPLKYTRALSEIKQDGIAILVQKGRHGQVIGTTQYLKSPY